MIPFDDGALSIIDLLAAEIAIKTVRECLDNAKSVKHVIFNVFKDMDKMLYENILG